MINWVINPFWLLLTHDLSEERRTDDVTIDKIFLFIAYNKPYSMFPCVCRVIDHGRPHNVVKKSLTLSAAPRVPRFYSNHIWRHLWLITKQTYGNTESISLKAYVLDYFKRSGLFPWSVMGKKTSKLDKVAVTHMLVFSTLSYPRLLRVYSFSVDFYLLPQKNMLRFHFNNKKR